MTGPIWPMVSMIWGIKVRFEPKYLIKGASFEPTLAFGVPEDKGDGSFKTGG